MPLPLEPRRMPLINPPMRGAILLPGDTQLEVGLPSAYSLATRSPIRSPIARAEAHNALHQETENLRARLYSMCTQLNALVPISLLPPELLSHVFRHLRDSHLRDSEDFVYYVHLYVQRLRWVTVTHVCRRWRHVALEDASLWSKIEGVWLNWKWLPEVLARSKQVPIDITHSNCSQRSNEIISTVSQHLSRIRALTFQSKENNPQFDGPQLDGLLCSKAPFLEELTLNAEPKLFDGHAPRLRRIHLYLYRVPWIHFPKLTLTHLEVTAYVDYRSPVASGSLDQLIKLLSESGQALELLSLGGCLHPPLPHITQMRTIEFPRLHSLYLAGSSSCIAYLVNVLEMPIITKLYLHLVAEDPAEVAQWPAIIPIAFSRFSRIDLTFRRLYLDLGHSYHPPTIRASSHTLLVSSQMYNSPLADDITLELKFDDRTSMSRRDWIYSLTQKWVHLLGRCAQLRALEVGEQHVDLLFQAMMSSEPARLDATSPVSYAAMHVMRGDMVNQAGPSTSSQGGHDTARVEEPRFLLPQLTSLHFNDLDFMEIVSDAGSKRFIDLATDLIVLRESWGAPIKELEISCCSIPLDCVEGLRKLVTTLDWDGAENGPSEDEEDQDEANNDTYYISD
ncbi:hypothetical protein BC834DRAFT_406287 [Gloeopeniophorella convolvens]|nr:hypothetical protein BC834DRAFT_406287 [Gloeopeniophorella convolvens]